MDVIIPIALLTLHVLSGVFWGGSTSAAANLGSAEMVRLFPFQIGAGAGAVLTGGLLWIMNLGGAFYLHEQILLAGIIAAAIALLLQFVRIGSARKSVRAADSFSTAAVAKITATNRAAAALLALTIASMIIAKFF